MHPHQKPNDLNQQRYRLTTMYDGTNYSGWQIQPNAPSIQEQIQNGLKILLKENVTVTGAGRTDAGVHAKEQTAHFSTAHSLDPVSFCHCLNGILPADIRIKNIQIVPYSFHARYSAKAKVYDYYFYVSPTLNPFKKQYATHIRFSIDPHLLKKALPLFTGTRDFSSFRSSGCGAKSPIKTLYGLDLIPQDDGEFCLRFTGNGFLYKMVRNLVGTLLEIACKKRPLEEVPYLFAQKNRRLSGPTAPPMGLFLKKIIYPKMEELSI